MKSRQFLLLLVSAALPLGLQGCASDGPAPGADAGKASVDRGRQVAQSQCAQCHQVGPTGASPSPMAPPFRTLQVRFNHLQFEKRFAEVESDHEMMPGFMLDKADVDDIAAYVETIKGQ